MLKVEGEGIEPPQPVKATDLQSARLTIARPSMLYVMCC